MVANEIIFGVAANSFLISDFEKEKKNLVVSYIYSFYWTYFIFGANKMRKALLEYKNGLIHRLRTHDGY